MNKDMIIKFFLVSALLVLFTCGCRHKEYVDPTIEQGKTMIKAVIDEDVESVKALFCPYIAENHLNLESEITGIFEFINGDIISYDNPTVGPGAGATDKKGRWEKKAVGASIDNIKTDSGGTYTIDYGVYEVNKEYPEYVGVTNITVYNERLKDADGGYPDEALYEIYMPVLPGVRDEDMDFAQDQSGEILDAIRYNDPKRVKKIFCSYLVKKHPHLGSEITGMLEFIEGDFLSFDAYASGPVNKEQDTDPKERWRKKFIEYEIKDIRTSTRQKYRIRFGVYVIYKKHPEYVGVTDITVYNERLKNADGGYPNEAVYKIQSPEIWE